MYLLYTRIVPRVDAKYAYFMVVGCILGLVVYSAVHILYMLVDILPSSIVESEILKSPNIVEMSVFPLNSVSVCLKYFGILLLGAYLCVIFTSYDHLTLLSL